MHIFSPISDIFPLIYLKQTKLQKISGWMKKNAENEEKCKMKISAEKC